jgi:ABC-type Fe3+-citrate transport system substrate-binding protein
MVRKGRWLGKRNSEKTRTIAYRLGKQNRHARGELNPKAKLSLGEVAAIKIDARPTRLLAAQYRVHRTTIQKIRRGALWSK